MTQAARSSPKPASRGRRGRWPTSIGVRQALLYRYFPSKDALVEAVFQRVSEARWTQDLAPIFADRGVPLEERLARVYGAYAEQDDGLGMRLFMRAALDGLPLPARRGATLTSQIVEPLVAELRHETRLPRSTARRCCRRERELA